MKPVVVATEDLGARPTRSAVMLPVVLVAMFMAQFDLYVVNVALPVLERDLSAGEAQLQLIVGGYAFTYAAGLVTGGRLGDHFGHRRMFMSGMAAFGIASLACGISPNAATLVGARLVQGLTAAMMVPQVLALITATIPAAQRPRALSWFGVTMGVGAVAGQVLGGVLLHVDVAGLGWRVIFLVNAPIAVVTLALAARFLPQAPARGAARLDLAGAAAITATLGFVLLPLVVGRSEGWPIWSWILLLCSVPAGVLFAAIERHVARSGGQPIVAASLFRENAFNVGLGLSVILFSAFFSFVFSVTLVLQNGLGLNPLDAGLTFGPLGVAFAVASICARPYVMRYGAKVTVVGTAIVAVAAIGLLVLIEIRGAATTVIELAVPMTLIGFGNGIAVPTVIGQVLARTSPSQAGTASGVLSTAQQFSSALGISVIGGIFFAVLGSSPVRGDYIVALRAAVLTDLVLIVIGIGLALTLARLPGAAARKAASQPPPEPMTADLGARANHARRVI